MSVKRFRSLFAVVCVAMAAMVFAPGCDRKEEVLDIETPNRDIEVERDVDNGNVDVDVEHKDN